MSEDEKPTIASAVVVPPQDEAPAPAADRSPTTLKRAADDSAENPRPIRRRTIAGEEEEKKRGKRLFGALLGTIGRFQKETTSQRERNAAVKRREVEEKLKEKLRAREEEIEEMEMRGEGKVWGREERRDFEERQMRLRHSNRLAQANMLQTRAEPKLFYLPWKLKPSEEDIIAAQVQRAQEETAAEEREFEERRRRDAEEQESAEIKDEGDTTMENAPKYEHDDAHRNTDDTAPAPDPDVHAGVKAESREDTKDVEMKKEPADKAPTPLPMQQDDDKDMEDQGEDIIEGGEDTVIY